MKSAEDCNVPPFKVRWLAVADPGADPKPLSALMLIVPEFIVVVPAYVLTPDKVKVPEPS